LCGARLDVPQPESDSIIKDMRHPLVAIIIPVHNRVEATLQCLQSVRCLDYQPHRVVVVDDGSSDGTASIIRERFPEVELLSGDGNLWWSGAMNKGCRHAICTGAECLFLLNNDVAVSPKSLSTLVSAHQAQPNALFGSRVVYAQRPHKVWCCGGRVDWSRRGAYMLQDGSPEAQLKEPFEVDWLPGMGTLVPATIYTALGGFDQTWFPQYFGDTDFCLRARKAGIPVMVDPRSQLANDVQSTGLLLAPGRIRPADVLALTTSLRSHMNVRVRLRFLRRHCPAPLVPWQVLRTYVPFLTACVKKLCIG
jgi:GT2 family glycosyltransferase